MRLITLIFMLLYAAVAEAQGRFPPTGSVFGGITSSSSSLSSDGLNTFFGSPSDGNFALNVATGVWTLTSALPTLTGTPAAGDFSYWTGATSQALLTPGTTGAYVRSAGAGAAPIWSTLILPNAATAGTMLVAATANTVTATATPTLGASGTLGSITMGNATSGTVTIQPVTGALGTTTLTAPVAVGTGRIIQVIAEGATAHNYGNLATGACETITTAATGTATTDVIEWAFNEDISAITGWGGAGTALTLYRWPTANNVNFRACNFTGGADINATSVTINWKVIR